MPTDSPTPRELLERLGIALHRLARAGDDYRALKRPSHHDRRERAFAGLDALIWFLRTLPDGELLAEPLFDVANAIVEIDRARPVDWLMNPAANRPAIGNVPAGWRGRIVYLVEALARERGDGLTVAARVTLRRLPNIAALTGHNNPTADTILSWRKQIRAAIDDPEDGMVGGYMAMRDLVAELELPVSACFEAVKKTGS